MPWQVCAGMISEPQLQQIEARESCLWLYIGSCSSLFPLGKSRAFGQLQGSSMKEYNPGSGGCSRTGNSLSGDRAFQTPAARLLWQMQGQGWEGRRYKPRRPRDYQPLLLFTAEGWSALHVHRESVQCCCRSPRAPSWKKDLGCV